MSDTDKDKPDWVTAEWWEPFHICGRRFWPCDLPDEPDRKRDMGWAVARRVAKSRCRWWPVVGHRKFRYKTWNPPGWFVHDVWTGVERVSVRDDCRRAITEHRATGEVETEPSTRQHRHCAGWLWD